MKKSNPIITFFTNLIYSLIIYFIISLMFALWFEGSFFNWSIETKHCTILITFTMSIFTSLVCSILYNED